MFTDCKAMASAEQAMLWAMAALVVMGIANGILVSAGISHLVSQTMAHIANAI